MQARMPLAIFCWATSQTLFPTPVLLHRGVMTQVQDLTLHLMECYAVELSPLILPIQARIFFRVLYYKEDTDEL